MAASQWKKALGPAVREVRLQFCPVGGTSAGMRDFVRAEFAALKGATPALPVLVRESPGAEPRVVVRFDYGAEVAAPASGQKSADVASVLRSVLKEGDSLPKLDDSAPAVK